MEKNKGLLILFFISLAIVILVILNFFLPNILEKMRKETHIESEKITIRPELVENTENIYLVDINFRTSDDSGNLNKISALSFSLTYPNDPNNSVEVQKVEVGPEIIEPDWEVPINKVDKSDTGVTIQFAAVNLNPEGYSSVNGTTLAKVYFKAEQPLKEDSFILNFDSDDTVILTKTSPTKNIRGDNDIYYSVEE